MKKLLCKYKQLLIGITIGSLITAIPVGAAVQEYILYKSECTLINSDGTKYEDADYPVLSYKGSNYVSIGKVSQFLGVPFTWEGNTKTAKFEKPLASNTQNTKEGGESVHLTKPTQIDTDGSIIFDPYTNSIGDDENATIDNIKVYKVDNKKYVFRADVKKILLEKNFSINDNGIITDFNYDKTKYFNKEQLRKTSVTLITLENMKNWFILYDDWENIIIPFIKQGN